MSLASLAHSCTSQLLASATVYVSGNGITFMKCRALLDTCATANFISESIVKRLNVPIITNFSSIGAINGTNTLSKGIVNITMKSIRDEFSKSLTCLTIPTIADLIPSEIFPRDLIKIPSNIKLADPEFRLPRAVDLLIGAGATLALLSIGQISLSLGGRDLYLQKTRLGWVIAGDVPMRIHSKPQICNLTGIETQIEKFWTTEEVNQQKFASPEELQCQTHFDKTVSRNIHGRYIVSLPFRNNERRLGDSRNVALKRLASLERKLNMDKKLKFEYTRIINEYLNLKVISKIKNPDDDGYYMPHHPVIKESSSTTKVRIVLDASAKTSNVVSLNDVLLTGPTIQDKLFVHLIRFRTYNYVLTADIEKMYLQVLLHEDDRQYQRILWRTEDKVETYQFNTLVFGVSSSPFLAIRTLQELAKDEYESCPKIANIIKNHLYVDDLITGANSVEEAWFIREEVIAFLARGGFKIRQWASNNEQALQGLSANALHANVAFDTDNPIKTLGIIWNTQEDEIRYSTHPVNIANGVTKRHILSEIAKIFDPLGLLGPVILYAKKLMQDLWRCKLDWDESVPQTIHTDWLRFTQELELINRFSLERKILVDDCVNAQIHGFCDASNAGYGACLYVRSSNKNGKTITRLLCAKSRVAPLKSLTIPRLELCGALLLTRLHDEVSNMLHEITDKTIFWCDSTIVLHWIKTPLCRLKSYVANRVAEIQERTKKIDWRHIKSDDNPADGLSRGQLPQTLFKNHIWFHGPVWINKDKSEWPAEIINSIDIPELKKNTCLISKSDDVEVFTKYSCYSKLLRVIAYCLRFRCENKWKGPLTIHEIDDAEIRVLKNIQASCFHDDIEKLKKKGLSGKERIINLNPFLDKDGLIRVGGRLQNSNLNFTQKHPILLPAQHHITNIIIREIHERHFHAGIQTTLYNIRQKFWLIDGRNRVRRIIRECIRCFRTNANTTNYKMGNLPATRVREAVPFTNTGVDFCGPFYIKEKKYQNRKKIKVYVCVFVCLSIKAVHLEVVSDLSTEGFLAAMRRFISRRGLPEHVHSDNGTNFVGANNQLKELYATLNSGKHKNIINGFALEHRITWHFIPPAAPHFGGLWESTVKRFKHHLKRVIGDSLFTFEELNTFATEVEAILNSRPITSLSSDPNDILVLTPAHYLIGKSLTTLPEGNYTSIPANRLSTWQHITKVRQDFWTRWNLEYLNELQIRNKWCKDGPKIATGTVVLIKDKNLPCSQWVLGKITKLHSGDDGIARAASIKTATGELKRATNCLCPLPVEQPS